MELENVGPDAPTVTNEHGGNQSAVQYRFDLLPTDTVFEVAKVLKEGAEKYGVNNWHKIGVDDHVNHAIIHLFAYLHGDRSDDHLTHAVCRAMFADHMDRRMRQGPPF